MNEKETDADPRRVQDMLSDPAGYLLREARLQLIDISKQVTEPAHGLLLRGVAENIGAVLSILAKKEGAQALRR